MEPGCTAHIGPIWVPIWDPYGTHMGPIYIASRVIDSDSLFYICLLHMGVYLCLSLCLQMAY